MTNMANDIADMIGYERKTQTTVDDWAISPLVEQLQLKILVHFIPEH